MKVLRSVSFDVRSELRHALEDAEEAAAAESARAATDRASKRSDPDDDPPAAVVDPHAAAGAYAGPLRGSHPPEDATAADPGDPEVAPSDADEATSPPSGPTFHSAAPAAREAPVDQPTSDDGEVEVEDRSE